MNALELDGVDAFYDESHVLHDVSMTISAGEIVALLGRNGAGKTTTFRAITGLIDRTGTLTHHGTDVSAMSAESIARGGVALVPEARRVFPSLTVRENLQLARDVCDDPRSIDSVFEQFELLASLAEQPGRTLSGGEKQLLSIARALVQDPSLLLLDEPTEGLAPVIVETLQSLLQEIAGEKLTVGLAEQNAEFALSLAQRAYIIENGRIVWNDTVEALEANEELLERHLAVSKPTR